jgi:flagellar biosynthesis protein FlhA
MPGKQMAIDADLSSGLLTEAEARKRRRELELESNFFGSMDGAGKFVRGDAIAGLLITFINIIGGIFIGVMQQGMTFADATTTFTIMTVGDGLVSQIPALIVSVAAGFLVSKSGIEGTTDSALFGQLSGHPAALGMCAFLMALIGVLPGIPIIPFFLLAGACAYGAWSKSEKLQHAADEEAKVAAAQAIAASQGAAKEAESIPTSPKVDLIRLELGYALLGLVSKEYGNKLPDQINKLRLQYANDLGFVIPTIRLQDNLQITGDEYVIRIKETEAGRGTLRAAQLMVMDPKGESIHLAGEHTRDPSFGIPAMWITEDKRHEAETLGYTIVDPEVVLITHLSEVIKDNIADLLTYGDVQRMLDGMPEAYKKLLNDIVPSQISVGSIQRILQNLISERVSIRDLATILEGIAEGSSFSRNLSIMTEHVRSRLSRQISFAHIDSQGTLPILTLSPDWENAINESLIGDADNRQLALAPSKMQELINYIRQTYDSMSTRGEAPVLVTSPVVRPYVRSILERARPATVILSQTEVHPKIRVRNLGHV